MQFLQTFGIPLVFVLFPLGLYVMALAHLNRRPHPVLVPGSWDAAGTLFAASGLLLVLVPSLLDELYYRAVGVIPADGPRGLFAVWSRFWFVWLVYYLALVVGAAWLVAWRGSKTMIYNLDTDRIAALLGQALARLDLTLAAAGPHVAIQTAPPADTATKTLAEVTLDPFPAGHHVTLDWKQTPAALRHSIESALRAELRTVTTPENATAGLLLLVSGFLFGLVSLIALLYITSPYLRRF